MGSSKPLRGVFGLLPSPYGKNLEIDLNDLRSVADFCCQTGQEGIVWPAMVGEFDLLGETERVRGLDAVLEAVNGRLPVVFGCSATSIPQIALFGRAARLAGADAVLAMPPSRSSARTRMEAYQRLAEAYQGPIVLQNHPQYGAMSTDEVAKIVAAVPQIEYVKEERSPGPHYIGEIREAIGDRLTGIFGGFGGITILEDLQRGADGCMPACELADILAIVMRRWQEGDEAGARELHKRLLPLIVRETYPFIREILKRRGVLSDTTERAGDAVPLDTLEKQEISVLLADIRDEISMFPFQ